MTDTAILTQLKNIRTLGHQTQYHDSLSTRKLKGSSVFLKNYKQDLVDA